MAACAIIILFFDKAYFSEKFVLVEDSKGKEIPSDKTVQIFQNLGKIICNKIFLFSSLCSSVAFFAIGVVQFYGDKYMEKVLKIDANVRFILFALLCLLGPTSGMVFGGLICTKFGGYVKRKSMTFVIISMGAAAGISMAIACHEIPALFVITGWTFLFGIGAVIPPISGIIISCLDLNLRGDGFSICNLLNNLIGSFPSSYVYSLLVDGFEKEQEEERYRYAWMITMGYNFIGLLYVLIAGIFRYRIKGDLSEDVEEKKNLTEKGNEN
jgi:MFS family permease